jgi:hypothetical protein
MPKINLLNGGIMRINPAALSLLLVLIGQPLLTQGMTPEQPHPLFGVKILGHLSPNYSFDDDERFLKKLNPSSGLGFEGGGIGVRAYGYINRNWAVFAGYRWEELVEPDMIQGNYELPLIDLYPNDLQLKYTTEYYELGISYFLFPGHWIDARLHAGAVYGLNTRWLDLETNNRVFNEEGLKAEDLGATAGLDLHFNLSRNIALGVYFEYQWVTFTGYSNATRSEETFTGDFRGGKLGAYLEFTLTD